MVANTRELHDLIQLEQGKEQDWLFAEGNANTSMYLKILGFG